MQYRKLGRTGIEVSSICLGTMTWGSQNNQAEADAQLDLAIGEGVNFIDTAEMYPTTPRTSETFGETETILGNWLKGRADRDKLIVATKVTGEGNSNVRGGARVTGKIVREALEASLVRLQTDYADLYQLHWPNRGSYSFRRNWKYDPSSRHVGNMEQEVADILVDCDQDAVLLKVRQKGAACHTNRKSCFYRRAENEGQALSFTRGGD